MRHMNIPIPIVDVAHTSVFDMVAAGIRVTIAESIVPLLIWPFLLIWRGFWVLVWDFGLWFLCGVIDSVLIQHDDGAGAAIVSGLKFMVKGPYWMYADWRDQGKIAAAAQLRREQAANTPDAVETRRRAAAMADVNGFVDEANRRRRACEYQDVPADEFNLALRLARVEALKESGLLPKSKGSPRRPGPGGRGQTMEQFFAEHGWTH